MDWLKDRLGFNRDLLLIEIYFYKGRWHNFGNIATKWGRPLTVLFALTTVVVGVGAVWGGWSTEPVRLYLSGATFTLSITALINVQEAEVRAKDADRSRISGTYSGEEDS